MVTTIKITGDGVFIQSNGGVGAGGAGGSARLQQQERQELLTGENTLGSTALGEANLPSAEGTVRNGSLDLVDSGSGGNDTNNNHKGYRNFNHRRYQSDEGPGFIGMRNGKPPERADGASPGSSEVVSGESDDTLGEPDPSRKRDKFTISFLNTHRSSGGGLLPNGGGKSMLNHKFIVYNSKKPKTSSVLHQQYYQQSIAAAAANGELGSSGSGSPPLPYPSHYQQYLYNRLRPSLSTSVLSSPSLITAAAIPSCSPPDRDRLEQQQQHQLYQNSLFHQQHRSLLGTPPAAVPGWAKSTSCLVSSSAAAASSYRTVTASPLLLLPAQPARSAPQPYPSAGGTAPRPVPTSSSNSSLSSSPSSFSAGSPPSSGANSSSNTPPPPVVPSEVTATSANAVTTTSTTTCSSPTTLTTTSPDASNSPTPVPPPGTVAPSTPTQSSSPSSSTSNLDVDVSGVPRFDRSTKPASSVIGSDQYQKRFHHQQQQPQQRSFDLPHSESVCDPRQQEDAEDSSLVARRNSTGSSVALNGMNSHTAAINLQHPGTGQTAVVGHHRGFSSTVVAAANSAAASASATDCPWFLPHQMPPPPTAPARQHKRPAPQPGGATVVGGGGGGGGGGPGSHMQPPQFISPPPAPQQQQQQQQHQQQHSQQSAIVPPPQLPPHSVNPSLSSIHHPVQQLVAPQSAQQQPHQPPIPPHPAVQHHIPKSPNQHHPPQPASAVLQHNPQAASAVGGGVLTNNSHHSTGPPSTGAGGPPIAPVTGSAAANMMSTSMNSAQLQGHILQPVGGLTGSALSIHQQQQQQQQQQSAMVQGNQPVHHMSNSLHGPIGLPTVVVPPAGHDGSNGVGGPAPGWNCVPVGLSSPTTSAAAAAQRRAEVNAKLNAMPWFHGRIKREEAESLLKPREDGLFLVRESTNFPGDYTLCVCFNEKVEHYRIKYVDNKLTIDDDEYFDHLGQLVEHYTLDSDGLCTKLMKALPKEEFCVKDFQDNGWEIKMEDLQLKENIGKGEFGDVMLGIMKGEKVAVKVLKDAGRASNKFLAEAGVMTTLEHENLVKFIGLVFHDKYIYLVTEYMSKGSLVDYLRSRGRQHISRKDQINFAYDTCCGMEYLETKKVIHRDLAARNVLISEDCVAKVSDFGLARDERYTGDSSKLPIKWTAPEALKEGKFSNKTDMWSFGILLWEIYSFGRVPYPRIPLADVVKHVGSGYKMEAPEGCPPEIYEMMRQAWDLVPEKRPTFAELKRRLYNCKRETANTYVT